MKCKVINCYKEHLEEEINNWLTNNYEIIEMYQSISSDGYITFTIFYLDIKGSRILKLHKLNSIINKEK